MTKHTNPTVISLFQFMESFNHLYEEWNPMNIWEIISKATHPQLFSDVDLEDTESDDDDDDILSVTSSTLLESESESEFESESECSSLASTSTSASASGSTISKTIFIGGKPRIVSIEGNIGAGKSTIIDHLKAKYKNNGSILFLQEPVDIWENFIDARTGENMIEKFYKNINKYAFSFQVMAYYSRLQLLKKAIETAGPEVEVIVMERSLESDYHIFAKMLYQEGCMEEVEYQIYCYLSQEGLNEYSASGIIWLQVDPETCFHRVANRAREGETGITSSYLYKCEQYHKEWLGADTGFTCDIDGVDLTKDMDRIHAYLF